MYTYTVSPPPKKKGLICAGNVFVRGGGGRGGERGRERGRERERERERVEVGGGEGEVADSSAVTHVIHILGIL